MASNARKQGGRVTAKGTQPVAKKKGPGSNAATAGRASAGDTPTDLVSDGTPNRQMRRAGHNPEPVDTARSDRMRWILIAAGAVVGIAVILLMVFFHVSGTWIGLLGLAAGVATGLAVGSGKTWFADKGRYVAIALAVVGLLVAIIGTTGVVYIHWPIAALLGCGAGAFFAELTSQQMTPPQGPPASAVALLKRMGAQRLEAPATGGCVWATPDGKVRVIVGASVPEGTAADKVLTDKHVRKSRQRGALLLQRMGPAGAETGLICVVDTAIATTRDGGDTICSAAGLTKALGR